MGLTWRDVFNSGHRSWGFIDGACSAAHSAGYPYFIWNDLVYRTADKVLIGPVSDVIV